MGIFFELNSCCCFNLRTGTSIILWFSTVISGLFSLILLGLLAIPKYENNTESAVIYFTLLAAFVYIVTFEFLPNVLGLYAIFSRKPTYLRMYVILRLYELATLLAGIVTLLLMYITHSDFLEIIIELENNEKKHKYEASVGFYVFGKTFSLLLMGLIQLYFISVVHNYYLKLKAEVSSHQSGYALPPK